MKTKLYSHFIAVCCIAASFTSCLEFTELKSNIPDSVKTETAEIVQNGNETYIHLQGTSDAKDKNAHFLLSIAQNMTDAEEIKASVESSDDNYLYTATYGPAYPSVTYYYQLIVGGVESGISQVKMNDPVVKLPENGAKQAGKTIYLDGLVTPTPIKQYFLLGTSENKDEAMVVDARLGDYYDGLRYCEATYNGLASGTQYYYWLVAVYPNGNDGENEFVSSMGTFKTASELNIVSAMYLPHDATSASDAINCEEWDIWNFVLEDPSTNSFTTYKATKKWDAALGFTGWDISLDGKQCTIALDSVVKTMYAYCPFEAQPITTTNVLTANIFYPFYYAKVEGISGFNSDVNVLMTSPQAKVNLHFATTEENPETRTIKEVQMTSESLGQKGYFDMKTEKYIKTTPWEIQYVMSKFSLSTTPRTATLYLIPGNTEKSTVLTVVFADNTSKSIVIPEATLEAGKRYDFTVTIEHNSLAIGDVVVEEWQNGEGGDMNIK